MRKRSPIFAAVLLVCAGLAGATAPLRAAIPVEVAVNRCNSQTADDAYARVRDFDRNAPGGSSNDLLQRIGVITGLLATLREERDILDSICASDAARAPLFAGNCRDDGVGAHARIRRRGPVERVVPGCGPGVPQADALGCLALDG